MYELHYQVNIPIMSPQVRSLKRRKGRGNNLRNMEDAKRDGSVPIFPINILSELHSHVQTRLISPSSSLEDCSSLAEDELGLSFFLLAAASSSLCFLSFSLKALLLSTAVWNSGPLMTGGLGGGFGGGGDGAFAVSRGWMVWTNTYRGNWWSDT